MRKVIVTGATSMMGCSLVRSLLRHGVERIYAVIQANSKNIGNLPKDNRIILVTCSCIDYEKLPAMIGENCDTFYHFAWIHSSTTRRERYFDVDVGLLNIQQSIKALESAVELGCRQFIGAGSQAEYGRLRAKIQSPDDPTDPVTAYGITKDCVRRLCMIKAEQLGINVQWVRIFSVYGPHDRKNTLISSIIPKLLQGQDVSLTDCEQIWDYLYEDDAGEGLYYAGLSEGHGSNIYCLGSGEAKKLKFFVEEIRNITKSSSKLMFGAIPHTGEAVMNLHADIKKLMIDTGWSGPHISFSNGILLMIGN